MIMLVAMCCLLPLLNGCAPLELQGSFEGKFSICDGTISQENYRITFFGDGRGRTVSTLTDTDECFTYSVSGDTIAVTCGKEHFQLRYSYDSENEKLMLYTKSGEDSSILSSIKE